jgi:hypothetical protein
VRLVAFSVLLGLVICSTPPSPEITIQPTGKQQSVRLLQIVVDRASHFMGWKLLV